MKNISVILFILSILLGTYSYAETWDTTCIKNDCFRNGWTTDGDVASFHLEAKCTNNDCLHSGWTSLDGNGATIDVTCKDGACFKVGWHSVERRFYGDVFIDDAFCTQSKCLTNGWNVVSSYDDVGKVTCNKNNCSQIGGQSFWRSRRSTTTCKEHDCYHNGWVIHFIDPAVPPTF